MGDVFAAGGGVVGVYLGCREYGTMAEVLADFLKAFAGFKEHCGMSVTETVEGTAAKFLLAELLEVSHGVGSHLTAFVSGADGRCFAPAFPDGHEYESLIVADFFQIGTQGGADGNTACAAGGLG